MIEIDRHVKVHAPFVAGTISRTELRQSGRKIFEELCFAIALDHRLMQVSILAELLELRERFGAFARRITAQVTSNRIGNMHLAHANARSTIVREHVRLIFEHHRGVAYIVAHAKVATDQPLT